MSAFFTVTDKIIQDDSWEVDVELNPVHEVYKGHFPDKPTAPGVFLVQLVKEIIEMEKGYPLKLSHAKSIKFLKLIEPSITHTLKLIYLFDPKEEFSVKVEAKQGEDVYFKVAATFVRE